MNARTSLLAGALASAFAVSSAAQTPPPRPPLEPSLPAGFRLDARWDLAPDTLNTPVVLGHVVRSAPGVADEHRCFVAWLVRGGWQVSDSPSALGDDPADCLSAARVDGRWVFGRWTLGGSGDGRQRSNDSEVALWSLVGGRLQRVAAVAVLRFGRLGGGDMIDLRELSPRREMLVWNADHTALVPRPAPARR